MTEIVKVYTKYDAQVLVVHVPYVLPITKTETPVTASFECALNYIEEGLEGVRYFHYKDK